MGNPWLFRGIRCLLNGQEVPHVTLAERLETALLQTRWMVEFKGERLGIVEMRKHVGHYINGLRGASEVRRRVNLATTLPEMQEILEWLRQQAAAEENAE